MKSTHHSAAVRNWEDKDMLKLPLKEWILFCNDFDFALVAKRNWSEVSKMIDDVMSI